MAGALPVLPGKVRAACDLRVAPRLRLDDQCPLTRVQYPSARGCRKMHVRARVCMMRDHLFILIEG
jgi:hypothetical protein